MKNLILMGVLLLFSFLSSCDKEDVEPVAEMNISHIALAESYAVGQTHEISLTITKPTPCHVIEEEPVNVSGKTYSYYFKVVDKAEMCIQVVKDESVSVDFEPAGAGEYTLKFYINNELYETKTVLVTD